MTALRHPRTRVCSAVALAAAVAGRAAAHPGDETTDPPNPAEEAAIHTPPGFSAAGLPAPPPPPGKGATLHVVVRDADTGQPTCCRVNVVGSDGNFYEPRDNPLAPWSLQRLGNREGKGPIRYFGWFFYTAGDFTVDVPAGATRVEAWKGYEYNPETSTVRAAAREKRDVALTLRRTLPMRPAGYASGDTHLHFKRTTEAEEERVLDLLSAEDVRFGFLLCLNDTRTYTGDMARQDCPQTRGFGPASVRRRGPTTIASGQEYRCNAYGHICLLLHRRLVSEGATVDPNRWPVFGEVVAETRALGGAAIHAHGGYAQEIWADVAQRAIDGVELLQFARYRGIARDGWYRILNAGLRLPAVGASDYPYCRALADARTYVRVGADAGAEAWLRGAVEGRSFFTTGPMLLLTVDGHPPGDALARAGPGPHRLAARVRARCEVAPVSRVELIVNGRAVAEREPPAPGKKGEWVEIEQPIELTESSWIAARASSLAPRGTPDAEAHTNPVYVDLDGRAAYRQEDLDWLLGRVDAFAKGEAGRDFPERERVVAFLARSREALLKMREAGGLTAPRGATPR